MTILNGICIPLGYSNFYGCSLCTSVYDLCVEPHYDLRHLHVCVFLAGTSKTETQGGRATSAHRPGSGDTDTS